MTKKILWTLDIYLLDCYEVNISAQMFALSLIAFCLANRYLGISLALTQEQNLLKFKQFKSSQSPTVLHARSQGQV